jgi:hypothetical protein
MAARVTIAVPGGEDMAKKTTHARLGLYSGSRSRHHAAELGGSPAFLEDIRAANTARHVLDLFREAGLIGITTLVCRKVVEPAPVMRVGDWRYGPASWISEAVCSGARKRFHERHASGILSTMMSGPETGFILDPQ